MGARLAPRRAGPRLGLRAAHRARRSAGPRRASPSRCGSCSRSCCGRAARSRWREEGGVLRSVAYRGEVPHLFDSALYRPARRRALEGARIARRHPVGQRPRLRRLPAGAAPGDAARGPRRGDRMSATTPPPRRSRCSAGWRWRRSCRGRSSRPRRACRAGAAPRRCSPTATCASSGARASPTRSRPPSSTASRPAWSPRRPRSRCCWCRSPASPRTGASATTRSSSSACFALGRFALAASSWDTGSGFALMGSSRDLTFAAFGRGAAARGARPRRASRRRHRARGDGAGGGRLGPVERTGALVRGRRLRPGAAGRDRPPADRQPRHPPRADDDPRGAAARVRGPRPGAAAVERGRPPLDRAGARRRASSCPTGAASAPSSPTSPAGLVVLCAGLAADRDDAGEDADPARPRPADGRLPARLRRPRHLAARGTR